MTVHELLQLRNDVNVCVFLHASPFSQLHVCLLYTSVVDDPINHAVVILHRHLRCLEVVFLLKCRHPAFPVSYTHLDVYKRQDEYMCDPKADPPDALKEGIQQGYEERKDFPEVLPQGIWDKVNVQRFSMKNCGFCEKKCKYYNCLLYTSRCV